jgi:hypothetical protein
VTALPANLAPAAAPTAPAEALVGPDHLAGGVLRSLSRNFRGHFSWGVVSTFFIALVSFGVAPLLRWTQNLNRYVRLERTQLWHLAEWLRLQTAHPDAARLPDDAEKIRWRGALAAASWAWLGAVVAFMVARLWDADVPGQALWHSTWAARVAPREFDFRPDVHFAWVIGLSVAYALHWLHLQLHAGDVGRFIDKLNRVLEWEGVAPLSRPGVGIGIQPLWVLAAVGLCTAGAFWGVPLMLAGAVQRRYISRTSARVRAEAADRVRTILLLRRPVMRVPPFARPTILCRTPNCRAPIPLLANFCARCGARAGTVTSDVA